MNILKRIGRHVNVRCFSSKASSTSPFIVEKLDKRSLIRVQGAEVVPFLQGLITNDMNHLKQHSNSVYTMFLNKAGKVLYDSIIYRTSEQDTYLIECDKVITQDLEKHLRLFRVRKKIDVEEVSTDYNVWVMFKNRNPTGKIEINNLIPQEGSVALKEGVDETVEGIPPEMKNVPEEALICNDPRLKELGARLIVPSSLEMTSIQKLFPKIHVEYSTETNDYKSYRYRLGVAEGIDELPPGKCFPLESNCDYLHGVSFHKGCYIGQELTARTHHTGVIRKRIMPFCSEEDIDQASEVIEMPNRKAVGKIRGIRSNFGIGLIRIEQALQSVSLYIGSVGTKVVIPEWWPKELPSKASLKIKQL